MNGQQDTIAAIATAPGRGGIGIVRLSGPEALQIAATITGATLAPRYATYCDFRADGELIDNGIALYFPAPHSFTGEDIVELQGHGGPVVMDSLLRETLRLGARLARAGEFSERAFLNDKIDLAQAEAIADLIDSASEQAARGAVRSLQGEFSQRIHALVEQVIQLRMYVEAAIDFPEEEIDFLSDGKVSGDLDALLQSLHSLLAGAHQGSLLREGMNVVIAGRPNAGKSSLLNALAGRESAIVTDVPGTTRDVLREHIQIDGMPLHIIDTAGLRNSTDPVEQEGVRRARQAVAQADRVLLVIDAGEQPLGDPLALLAELSVPVAQERLSVIYNKSDLLDHAPVAAQTQPPALYLSARIGTGIDALREHLKACMGYHSAGEGSFTARRRHIDALQRALRCLEDGREQLQSTGAGELLAEDLRRCQQCLGEITGAFTPDDLLGRIFSSFCIGK